MHAPQEVLAIIPARGGSKGIPRKNIVDLCGKPLIAWSIEVAKAAKSITRLVVSTEDEEIAAISREYGAEVPFLRPRDMAGDRADLGDCFDFTRRELMKQGYLPDIIATLYPTSPFRTPQLLDTMIGKLHAGYSQVFTVRPIKVYDGLYHAMGQDRTLRPLPLCESQNHVSPNVFFRRYGSFHAGAMKPQPFGGYAFLLNEPFETVDIDTFEDLYFAREIISAGLFDFRLP